MPGGFVGHRWDNEPCKWNLELIDVRDGSRIDTLLSFIDHSDGVVKGASQIRLRQNLPAQCASAVDRNT
jgi:hypothetical protein